MGLETRALTALLLCFACCRAFSPLRAPPCVLSRGVSARQRVVANAALAEAKDFLGWVLVPPPPPLESTTQVEGAELFRMVGVPPDASYEELTEQVEKLKQKYKGDIKKIKRIEVARDRIVELRLRQRAAGTIGFNTEAAAAAAQRKKKVVNSVQLPAVLQKASPKWMRKLKVPIITDKSIEEFMLEEQEQQRKHRDTAKMYFALTTVPGLLLPDFAQKMQQAAFALFWYHQMWRGRDKEAAADRAEGSRSDRGITWQQFFDACTTFFYLWTFSIIGKSTALHFPIISPVFKSVFAKPVSTMIGSNVGCFLVDFYLQVFDKKKNNRDDDGLDSNGWKPHDDDDDD